MSHTGSSILKYLIKFRIKRIIYYLFKQDRSIDKQLALIRKDLAVDFEIQSRYIPSKHINYLYDLDSILLEYAGSVEKTILAYIEHGLYFGSYVRASEVDNPFTQLITFSGFRAEIIEEQSCKKAVPIGPLIHYAREDRRLLDEMKRNFGRILLVMPAHTIKSNKVIIDWEPMLKKIEEIEKDYDTVLICYYYKDLLIEVPEVLKQYEFVTAGNLFSKNFLNNLKTIMMASDFCITNDIGTHIGYLVYLNVPVYFAGELLKYEYKEEGNNNSFRSNPILLKNKTELQKIFSVDSKTIIKKQYEICNYLWGFDFIRKPNQLNKLLSSINTGVLKDVL